MDWPSGVPPHTRRVDAPVSQASLGLLESPAMFHREVDGLQIIKGVMESLVEEQVASSSDDIVDENLRITSEEDNGASDGRDACKLCIAGHSLKAGFDITGGFLWPMRRPHSPDNFRHSSRS